MCGIAGYYDYKGCSFVLERKYLDNMTDALSHRGPDGRGIYQAPGIGLGHRRLAIIDITKSACQPMSTPDGKVMLIFNGEIYNFKDLKAQLMKSGYEFFSRSDTEVLLYSYLEWGYECVDKLIGVFAFAIWDSRYKRLWLVRDQLGVKPLYYSDYDGRIIFSSEIVSFFSFPDFPKEIDPYGLDAFFTFGYVPAPYTGYKNIRQLLPGQWLAIENNRLLFRKYWDIDLDASKIQGEELELAEEFERLLTAVVKRQMVSDVPIGAFMSSGVDSFAIVRAMQKINHGNTRVFSIGFREKSFDELPYTELAANSLGAKLTSQYFSMSNKLIRDTLMHCMGPFADSSSLPMYLLCQTASQHVKVALSGDGGDEIFGGYETYRANKYAAAYRKTPGWIRNNIKKAAFLVPETGKRYSMREIINRFIYGAEQGGWRDHASWRIIFTNELKKLIYTSDFLSDVGDFDPINLYTQPMKLAKEHGCSDLECLLYADLVFYLPNDMLVKVDRMSMANSLEVRVPFLDRELVEFAWRLPNEMKLYSGRIGKYILKKAVDKEFPKELKKLPKMGFNVPKQLLKEIPINGQNLPFLNEKLLGTISLDHYQNYALFIASNIINRHSQ